MVDKVEEYARSSAREHCGLEAVGLLCEKKSGHGRWPKFQIGRNG